VKGFLLDTNVVSMFSPSRVQASAAFVDWLERMDGEGRLFLCVVTVHEIEKGIALLEHRGATARAAALKVWVAGLLATYDDKILGIDATSAAFAGQLEAKAITAGHQPGMADASIAGIAKTHGLVVVTQNTKHFLPFGIDVATVDEAAQFSYFSNC
jgi:predicted nucleic acid-binding protein